MPRILDFADGFESSSEPVVTPILASSIANTPSGNLAATTMQGAVNELQGDIDTINNKVGAVSGIASLDSDGKIPAAQIPALALIDVSAVADIAARDALTVQEGDVAVVADAGFGVSKSYIYNGSGWTELLADGSLAAHQSSSSAHAAASITVTPTGNLGANDVQEALEELQTQVDGALTNPMNAGGDIIYGGASGTPTKLANGSANQYLKSGGGTSAPTWATFTPPTIQRFTSGSGTYTTPAGVKWIKVRMVGGGAGGTGGGTSGDGGAATAGSSSTFGSSLLTANPGGIGSAATGLAGSGGGFTVNSPAINVASCSGARGGNGALVTNAGQPGRVPAGNGGSSVFGGAGNGGKSVAGNNAESNTGSGGGGGGTGLNANTEPGPGGSAGGYVEAIIAAPSSTYAYAVGTGGSGGSAGTNGSAGGSGAAGIVIVEEYYQ